MRRYKRFVLVMTPFLAVMLLLLSSCRFLRGFGEDKEKEKGSETSGVMTSQSLKADESTKASDKGRSEVKRPARIKSGRTERTEETTKESLPGIGKETAAASTTTEAKVTPTPVPEESSKAPTPIPTPTPVPVPETEAEDETEPPEPVYDVYVYVDTASEALLTNGEYLYFTLSDSPYAIPVLVQTNVPVTDFMIHCIEYNPETESYDITYTADYMAEFDPAMPLVISMDFPGSFPNYAISFTDNYGYTRLFYFSQSGEDGSITVNEFY